MSHSFALLHGRDPGSAGRITVTCAELVDAVAARYFAEGCQLRMRIEPGSPRVRVELSGAATAGTARALEEAIATINRGTPAEAYTQALSLSSGSDQSLLGLARIRYEGQMTLSCQRRGARLWLTAETAG